MGGDDKVDCGRRRLIVATAAVGGAAGVVAVVPFVASMLPSERAKAAGAPVEVDISKLSPGQMMVVEWRGKPVWVINRTKEMIDSLQKTDSKVSDPNSDKPITARTRRARSSRKSWWQSGFALIWVAHQRKNSRPAPNPASMRTGQAAFSAPVMVPHLILPVASTRINRHLTILRFQHTNI